MFSNKLKKLHFSFERFVENRIRERFPFTGTPIIIKQRAKSDVETGTRDHRESLLMDRMSMPEIPRQACFSRSAKSAKSSASSPMSSGSGKPNSRISRPQKSKAGHRVYKRKDVEKSCRSKNSSTTADLRSPAPASSSSKSTCRRRSRARQGADAGSQGTAGHLDFASDGKPKVDDIGT